MNYLPEAQHRQRYNYGPNKIVTRSSPTVFLLKFLGASMIIFLFALVLMMETNIL